MDILYLIGGVSLRSRKNIPLIVPSGPLGQSGMDPIITDPNGSYTGITQDPHEIPIQDADDL